MKKIFLSLTLILGTLVFAQDQYGNSAQDQYGNPTQDQYSNSTQDYNGYEYYDNSNNYPDDYYYNYPTDYYPDQYYQGYYNDYQNAVLSVNWNQFFVQFRLSPFQINQIMVLNNRFASYGAWNSYYRYNPDRWYYDRFFALQNILGQRVFVVYQNTYFHGRSPFVYYRNRFTNFYAVRYPVRPMYRNVNINIYRIDRGNFRDGFRNNVRNQAMINPRNNNGFHNQPPRSGANGNWNNPGGIRNPQNGGVRNPQISGIRTPQNTGIRNPQNGGIRTPQNGGVRSNNLVENNVRTPNIKSQGIRSEVNGIRQSQNAVRNMGTRSNNVRNAVSRSESRIKISGSRFAKR